MNRKKYNQLRVVVALFVSTIVFLAVAGDSYLLAFIGVATGLVFMTFVRLKAKISIDEREVAIREKAAQLTYAVFAPTIGIGAFLLLIPYQDISPVFAKGEFVYLESLGTILAYLALFLITVYAISYHFLNRKFGGGGNEE
jgi:uncharacterized membrane protein